MTTTPAGWYPDPYGSPQLRWWDGSQWTDATHPLEGQEAPPPPQPAEQETLEGTPVPAATAATAQFAPPPPTPQWGAPPPSGQPQPWGATSQLPLPQFGAPPKPSSPLPWVLGGVGIVLVIALVVGGAFVFLNQGSRGEPVAQPPATSDPLPPPQTEEAPPPTEPVPDPTQQPQQPSVTSFPQPENGRIEDPVSGLSYKFLGEPWKVSDPKVMNSPSDPTYPLFTSAYAAVSQKAFNGQEGADWMGTVAAAQLPQMLPYRGVEDLEVVTTTLLSAYEPAFYSIPHERQVIRNEAIKVGDRDAWIIEYKMDFSAEAKEKKYDFKTESGAFVLVDMGEGKRPSFFYVSIPDNLKSDQVGDVLDSLQTH